MPKLRKTYMSVSELRHIPSVSFPLHKICIPVYTNLSSLAAAPLSNNLKFSHILWSHTHYHLLLFIFSCAAYISIVCRCTCAHIHACAVHSPLGAIRGYLWKLHFSCHNIGTRDWILIVRHFCAMCGTYFKLFGHYLASFFIFSVSLNSISPITLTHKAWEFQLPDLLVFVLSLHFSFSFCLLTLVTFLFSHGKINMNFISLSWKE